MTNTPKISLTNLAFKNLKRKWVRSVIILMISALASGLIFASSTIFTAIGKSLDNGMEKLGADIMVVPAGCEEKGRKILLSAQPTGFYMDRSNLDKVLTVRGVKTASPQLFLSSAKLQCCGMPSVLLVGYDPQTDFTIKPWMSGSYPEWKGAEQRDPVTIGRRLIFVSHEDVRFYGKNFKIGSVLAATGLGFIDHSIFMSMDVIRDMIIGSKTKSLQPLNITPDQISSVLVKVDQDYDIHAVSRDIEASVPGVKAISTKDLVSLVRKDVEVAIWGVVVLGVLCWIMMMFLMGIAFSMIVNERKRELGILRAIGANKMHVFRLIMSEALMLSGLGAVAGVALSWGIIVNFKKMIIMTLGGIQFLWPSVFFVCSVGGSCIILILLSGGLSALYPALKTCLKQPYDAIQGAQ